MDLGFSLHQAIGTSLIMMIFIAGTGALSHGFNEDINVTGLFLIGLFAAIGSYIGSHYASTVNEDTLARIVGIIIFVLGIIIILNHVL